MELIHNHSSDIVTTDCPACMAPRIPHVWTVDEIKKLPEFGSENGWFYGLVEIYDEDNEVGVQVAEIIPGTGWCYVSAGKLVADWNQIEVDLRRYRPENYANEK